MNNLTPVEVKETVSLDWKKRGISRAQAAKELGYVYKQSLNNLMAENTYFPSKVALRMHLVFGYRESFLCAGEGGLLTDEAATTVETATVFKDGGPLEKALILHLEQLYQKYGENNVDAFLHRLPEFLFYWKRQSHDASSGEYDRLCSDLEQIYRNMLSYKEGNEPFL